VLIHQGANALDLRAGDEFAEGHIPGSINIALAGQFASWAGVILGIHSKPILIGASDAQVDEARLRLARVGIEEVRGYLAGGVKAWREAGFPTKKTPQISPRELNQMLEKRSLLAEDVIDVRRDGEWQAGHIRGVKCTPLDTFAHGIPAIEGAGPVAVHCKSGYRSIIACSLLERAGRGNVMNVAGGFDAWHNAGLPEIAELASF
jgi:hydroxyacylglutathione hydrolase